MSGVCFQQLSSALPQAHMVPPSAGRAHMQPGLEVLFKAAEKLLHQTACQRFSFQEGDQFNVHAHALSKLQLTVMEWLSRELAAKPLTASRLMYGVQITVWHHVGCVKAELSC